ncbi:MAG: aminopeptidase, partial [Proteobacteria bacterium]|nr:aminopeptidase [Pseudomonadota bacterium]
RAQGFADRLKRQGFDVTLGGVAAYSTLGHFDDPILSSMLGWSDVQLASIVFHELTHQLIYVRGDSDFNEALATTVEQEGVTRWLRAAGREQDRQNQQRWQERVEQVIGLLRTARADFAALYRQRLAAPEMRRRKAARFEQLARDYRALSAGWGGQAPYQAWFAQPLNNAHLAAVATYNRCVPGFTRLLAEVGGDLPRFYQRARDIGRRPAAQREKLVCAQP